MSEAALVRVTRKGQMTIPQELREELEIEPGDYLTVRSLSGGLFVSKAVISSEIQTEDVLRSLVIGLGEAAGEQGIDDESDLDEIIDEIQERAYRERYGG